MKIFARLTFVLLIWGLLPLRAVHAQEVATLPSPPTPEGAFIELTPVPVNNEPVPLPTPIASEPGTDLSAIGLEQSQALPILLAARIDLDILATEAIGSDIRPVGWTGAIDPADPDLILKIRLDLDILAATVMGENRPVGWFGVVITVPIALARDIRHDLELLADRVIGVSTIRPAGWQGDNPFFRCGRATQALLTRLEADGLALPIDTTQPNFCDIAEIEMAVYVERNILQPMRAQILRAEVEATYRAETPFVSAFNDRNASDKVGILPLGTGFEVLGRSTFGFSKMMLIEGEGFRVYVDQTTTPVTADVFAELPDFDTITGEIFCLAEWCGVNVE